MCIEIMGPVRMPFRRVTRTVQMFVTTPPSLLGPTFAWLLIYWIGHLGYRPDNALAAVVS
jgi:hypothetical protein